MKRRMIKRVISFFLVLLLAASFLPVCVFAAEPGWNSGFFAFSDLYININNKTYSSQEAIEKEHQGLEMAWASSDPDIAPVDMDGVVTLSKPGDATITATLKNNASKSYRIHIYQINIKHDLITMVVGETAQNDVSLEPDKYQLNLEYDSNDADVVTVDAHSGRLYAAGEGTATISVHVSGSKSCEMFSVEVTDPNKVPQENAGDNTDTPVSGDDGSDDVTPDPGNDETGTDVTTPIVGGTDTGMIAPSVGETDPAVTEPAKAEAGSKAIVTDNADGNKTVTMTKTTSRSTVTKTPSSSGKSTIARKTSGNTGNSASEVNAEPVHTADTAAVINEPSVPTAAYISPADGGNGGPPGTDNMASHAGVVAGMLVAVAAGGAVAMVKAYKLKKYEADV